MIKVNGFILLLVGGSVGLGLRWAGYYDTALNVLVTVMVIGFVVMMVYSRVRRSSSERPVLKPGAERRLGRGESRETLAGGW